MSYESGPWVGESGFQYIFHVYRRDQPVPPRAGLYIYCKKNAQDVWVPVYMGQGDLAARCEADAELLAAIDGKGATHVHMRLCREPNERDAELADLLKRYRNTFAPEGCNPAPPAPEPAVPAPEAAAPA